ncbi:MAG: DUF2310 family Zn-ribbon-containing protein [Candidatus Sericytochromatia bacterium]
MHIYALSVRTSDLSPEQLPKLVEALELLAMSLHRHGHLVYGDTPRPYLGFLPRAELGSELAGLHLIVNLVLPDALAPANRKSYVKSGWERVETLAGYGISMTCLGQEPVEPPFGLPEACACERLSGYILDGERVYSAVGCLDCNSFVPIYTLPETYDATCETSPVGEGYDDIHFLRRQLEACDTLWFQGIHEALMVRLLNHPDSELSQTGRQVARRIEFLTGKPTYYLLMNTYETVYPEDSDDAQEPAYSEAIQKPCPSCGQAWLLPEPLHLSYHFQCHPCRLISELPANVDYNR